MQQKLQYREKSKSKQIKNKHSASSLLHYNSIFVPHFFPPNAGLTDARQVISYLSRPIHSNRISYVSGLPTHSLHSKRFQRARSELFFRKRENRARAKKKKKVVGGEERRRKRLRTNPSILKTPVRPRTGSLIGVSFSPLPLPPLSFFALAPIFARPKHRNLRGNPTETLATQASQHTATCPIFSLPALGYSLTLLQR